MPKAERNPITSKNFQRMWCKHARVLDWHFDSFAPVNRNHAKADPVCLGQDCPDLMFTTGDPSTKNWEGYCGATRK